MYVDRVRGLVAGSVAAVAAAAAARVQGDGDDDDDGRERVGGARSKWPIRYTRVRAAAAAVVLLGYCSSGPSQ